MAFKKNNGFLIFFFSLSTWQVQTGLLGIIHGIDSMQNLNA